MNSPNDNIHMAFRRIKRSAFGFLAERPIRKVSYILPNKLTVTGNPSMHLLCVWGGKWGQRTISVLELVPNVEIFAWAIGTSFHSIEKNRNWFGRQCHLNIFRVSSTNFCGSDTVELNEGWKLFYLGVDVTMSAQAEVGIFVSPRLFHWDTDWILFEKRVCVLKLKLQERLLCILQVYAPNAETQYHSFLDEVGFDLQKVTSAESISYRVICGYWQQDMECVIWRQGDSDVHRNGRCLLQFCAINGLCIMNIFF